MGILGLYHVSFLREPSIEEEILVMDLRKVSDEDKVNLCRKYTIHILLFILT